MDVVLAGGSQIDNFRYLAYFLEALCKAVEIIQMCGPPGSRPAVTVLARSSSRSRGHLHPVNPLAERCYRPPVERAHPRSERSTSVLRIIVAEVARTRPRQHRRWTAHIA